MASFLDKIKVKTAVEDRVKLDLGCDHITTANFMQFNVAWSKELVPKEKISVNMETFTRLNPMPVPTFGRAKINNRAFFVPFRTIFPAWNDFITDAQHAYATGETYPVNRVIRIANKDLVKLFLGEDYMTSTWLMDVVTDSRISDITCYYVDNGDESHIIRGNFTAKGRQFMKILESLGYKVIWNVNESAGDDTSYSALPLMALAKVYCDWYYPSAYVGTGREYDKVEGLFNMDIPSFEFLSVDDLGNIAYLFQYGVNYDSDYFVSAWDNPVAPNANGYSQITLRDPSVTSTSAGLKLEPGSGTPTANFGSPMTQWLVDGLKSLTDYMKRHQLVGARALDRYLARFGVNLSAEKLRRSVYLGSGYENIQFGDVMSTSDTEGAALGNYAGKGIGYGTANFDYETDEYGIMIIVSSIVPKAGYYQGINRNVMHVGKLDYWTPEFDNLGTQAISKSEVYVPMMQSDDDASNFDPDSLTQGIFGWTPRYAEYKIGRDMLTGDFRYGTINAGQEAWHTMRELAYETPSDIVHDWGFVNGSDADQYSRIFYNTDADAADKFNVIYHFEVASWSPMKALFDTYEFDSKGASVTEDANGVKMN